MIVSTASHFTLEEIAAAGGDGAALVPALLAQRPRAGRELRQPRRGGRLRRDRRHRRHLRPRLEAARPAAGLAAVPQRHGHRATTSRTRSSAPAWRSRPEEDVGAATGHFLGVQANPALTWDDLAWLRERTSLPILIKGIQHADDAREAARRGVDGIVVSNHGGRQVDGAIASLDALPPIADAVGDELAVLFDSGVRTGADVLKALALGADAVCLGRPYIWGLALDGQAGVEAVLKMVLAELDLTMALCGYTEPGPARPGAGRYPKPIE